jgi:hypothetical protein
MQPPFLLIALGALALAALAVWWARSRRTTPHAPVEYYRGWGGYWHPISPQNRISPEQAHELAARDAAYLIAYYDASNRLTQVVKMYRGEIFFDYAYDYHPNGKLKTARIARGGRVTELTYDKRGRRPPGQRTAF